VERRAHGCAVVISTDHCAFLWDGQKTMGKDDFSKIPNGGPGLENRLEMITSSACARAHLAEPDGRAARNEPGEALRALSAQGHDRRRLGRGHRHLRSGAQAHDFRGDAPLEGGLQPYEGTEVTGAPEIVFLRGNVLVEKRRARRVTGPSGGSFARAKFGQEARARPRAS